MDRYICIHGHFYQPPRENPSLEAIQLQDSAYPYHDWNERITAECYGPNAAARILGENGRIVKIINNYSWISFDFGPTLLSWMEEKSPEVHAKILAADRESAERFSGHGSATAQAYNHVIMPLANQRDKRTQVLWGLRDFEHRFARQPEGMWLPEAAVDLESLELMAESGIKFTILAQHQARRVRRIGGRGWKELRSGEIDPTRVYRINLPSGRKMSLFFYDGQISRAVAFEGLLNRGEDLANRLAGIFSDARSWPQLSHIATDGETYGHHHRHGEMALAYALHHIVSSGLARLTNYGEFLERYPAEHEVEIIENTAWSCAHGVERWRSDCGCNSGGYPQWNQSWRGPLREALDWLRDDLSPSYEQAASELLVEPWAARDDYITVVLDRSPENVDRFFREHATHTLDEEEKIRALKLLEMQRQAMLMYTSCGWFFDELSGIETVQVIQYAGRAVQLAAHLFGRSPEARFLELLEKARSNVPAHKNGRNIYQQWVKPSLADLKQVGAHYALSSLFVGYGEETSIYAYRVRRDDHRLLTAGRVRLGLGKATVTSEITRDSMKIAFGVLHLGDHNLSGGVREYRGDDSYRTMVQEMETVFDRADLPGLIRAVDVEFGADTYSLSLLFRDQQRQILNTILNSTLEDAEAVYRQMYENHAPTMRFLSDLNVPIPKAWHAAADLVTNSGLRKAFESEEMDRERIKALLDEAQRWQVTLDGAGLGYALQRTLERLAEAVRDHPFDLPQLERLEGGVELVRLLPFEVDLGKVQNVYFEMLEAPFPVPAGAADTNGKGTGAWLAHFSALGDKLGVGVADMSTSEIVTASNVIALAEEITGQRHVPLVTYRLQFNRDFTFRDALAILPYLHDLGISDLYASPILKARPGSRHGYDITDHSRLNPEIGSEADFEAFSAAMRERGMALILDMVPNHMGIGDPSNSWWMDVLENGPSSTYARYFDIDWHPVKPELENKVLLPVLEDQYGKVLESGKLQLSYEDGAFFVTYYGIKLPIAPRTYGSILSHQLATLTQALGDGNEQVQELQSILTALSYLPDRTESSPERIAERNREKEVVKKRISALYQGSRYVRAAIDTTVEAFNGVAGNAHSFDSLDELLDAQAYRMAFWRVAAEEINYRRFFDINELAAIQVQLPEVFDATHQLVLKLLAEQKVAGLRIDHPDGLWDPQAYFLRLQEHHLEQKVRARLGRPKPLRAEAGGSPAADLISTQLSVWAAQRSTPNGGEGATWPLYVVAEKILSWEETLPRGWAVDGTTGYDFLNQVNGVLVDGGNAAAFDRVYRHFIGTGVGFPNLANSAKKMIMLVSMASEIYSLSHHLERIAEKNRLYRDFTLNGLTFALREVIAALPVYRTYIEGPNFVGKHDETYLDAAVAEAKRRNPRTAATIFDFIRDTLLLRNLDDFSEEARAMLVDSVLKFQQVTGPVMAKGVEDTAFYVYNRLISLNEVGGHPEQFGIPVEAFHDLNCRRRQEWPHSLLATATHDTKRGEDVRARIDVLSEIPEEWSAALERWGQMNLDKKGVAAGEAAPDRNDEYLLYQVLLGAWPAEPLSQEGFAGFRMRIADYMTKATKEAKVHTSWINPNDPYDEAVRQFVARLLPDDEEDAFLTEMRSFQRRIAYFGRFNSLSQLLLKLTCPGVPDIYQGTELWDLSLVDPDNRRPVDYQPREAMLGELRRRIAAVKLEGGSPASLAGLAGELLQSAQDGRVKLYVTHLALEHRRARPQLFADGSYSGLETRGHEREHVIAFSRTVDGDEIVVAVPRLVSKLMGGSERPPLGTGVWRDCAILLPKERRRRKYRNIFTGETLAVRERGGTVTLPVATVLGSFPVALLELVPD